MSTANNPSSNLSEEPNPPAQSKAGDAAAKHELLASEYDAAGNQFFHDGMKALMEAIDPVYNQFTKVTYDVIPVYETELPDGQVIESRQMDVELEILFSNSSAISGSADDLLAAMNRAAMDALKQVMPQALGHIAEIAEVTGNTISGPLTYDVILDAIASTSFEVGENLEHNLSFVASPGIRSQIAALGEPTPEQTARYHSILVSKKAAQDAGRRRRSLPGDGDGA